MNGYYTQEKAKKESEVPAGRLRIEVANLPEFKELINQAKQEADQLNETINRLQYFELNIDFSSSSTSSEPKNPIIKKSKSEEGYKVVDYYCPSCSKRLFSTKNGSACGSREKYCCKCGQALTWKGLQIETYWPCDEMD